MLFVLVLILTFKYDNMPDSITIIIHVLSAYIKGVPMNLLKDTYNIHNWTYTILLISQSW